VKASTMMILIFQTFRTKADKVLITTEKTVSSKLIPTARKAEKVVLRFRENKVLIKITIKFKKDLINLKE
jgi:hypothetical protein